MNSSTGTYPCTGIDRTVGGMGTAKKVLLAKMEDEEGEQDLAHEQLRRVILVIGVLPVGGVAAGRGGSVYRHSPRAHQLAFSPPLCCPASPAQERRSPLPTPTSHSPEIWLVSRVVRSPRPAGPCGLHPGRQRRRACGIVDGSPRCEAAKG